MKIRTEAEITAINAAGLAKSAELLRRWHTETTIGNQIVPTTVAEAIAELAVAVIELRGAVDRLECASAP